MSNAVAALALASLIFTDSSPPSLSAKAIDNDVLAQRIEIRQTRPQAGWLECTEVGNPREKHLQEVPAADTQSLQFRGLKAQTPYRCLLQDAQQRHTLAPALEFRTAALPSDIRAPRISVPSTNLPSTGYTLYNYGYIKSLGKITWPSANYLVIVDAEGVIRWYYKGPGAGDVDASYIGNDQILFGGRSGRTYAPTITTLDKEVLFVATTQPGSPTEVSGEYLHDAGLSVDGESVFTFAQTLNDGGWRGFVIKEIDLFTNQVEWAWDSYLDGVLPGVLDLHDAGTGDDPFHPNAVFDTVENGHQYLYMSFWKTSQIFKIDYLTHDIVWTLGIDEDFTLLEKNGTPAADSRWFFNLHDVKRYGNLIYVHDNGNDRTLYGGLANSRALVLELDESKKTARIVSEYSEPDWAEPVWGGHDRLPNGNGLIAMGHCYEEDEDYYSLCSGLQTNLHPSALVEYNSSGKVVWRADFTTLNEAIYRAERIDGCAIFSNPTYCPALAGQH